MSRRRRDSPTVPQSLYDHAERRRQTAEAEVRRLRRELHAYQGGPSFVSDYERANVQGYLAVVAQLAEFGDPRRARSAEVGGGVRVQSSDEGFDEGRGTRHARGARRRLNERVARVVEEASICALGECSHPPPLRCWRRGCAHYGRTVPPYALVCPVCGLPVGHPEDGQAA